MVGEFKDSNGRNLKITPEVANDIYKNLNGTAPLKDVHMDGSPIGTIQKYVLKDDGIYQKSVITDVQRFESRYKDGHFYISPEIDVESDESGNVTSAKVTGAALTANPGMIQEKPMITRHYFEAQSESNDNQSWTEPLGELKSTINTLNDTLSTFGDKVKSMNNTPQQSAPAQPSEQPPASAEKLNLSVDDLAKLVNDAVEKRVASMQSPKTPEASETANDVQPNPAPTDELAKKYADMMGELDNLKKTQEKVYVKQLNAIVAEMKSLGIEHPEKMAPDGLSTEQKITILESIKENFAKNSPMSAPLQEPLAGSSSGNPKKPNALTVDDVLVHFDDVFGSTDGNGSIRNDPEMRHKLGKLSDPDLMRKYNMNVLFDQNGNYIGPL